MKEHAALVIKNQGKILFIKRSLNKKTLPGIWSFPSGTREEGEDIFQTAMREAKEELDLEIIPQKIIAEHELPEFSTKLIFILADLKNLPTIKDYDEIDSFEFMTFSEFFDKFSDLEIGHGLIWLRKNQDLLV